MLLHEWQQEVQQRVLVAAFPDDDHRLGIYHNAYRLRLAEALRTNYPALHLALGDDDFNQLAQQYLDVFPSQHPSIRWFGDRLPVFLAQQVPYAQTPVFAELAAFEWALRHTVDASDADRVTIEHLQMLAPDDWAALAFDLHPSVNLLFFEWNVPGVYRSLVEPESDDDAVSPQRSPCHFLVWRNNDLLGCWRSVDPAEKSALDLVQNGNTFGELCERTADLFPQHDETASALRAATWLRQWVEEGILTWRTPS